MSTTIRPIDSKYRYHNFFRKPTSFSEVTETNIPAVNIPVHLAQELGMFTTEELGIEGTFDSFKIATPMVFIVSVNGKQYLINTEGYNYCRYVLPCVIVNEEN